MPEPQYPAQFRQPRKIVHHLYRRPGDLLPYCGVIPGPDAVTGDWNTGHPRDELMECIQFGLVSCITCLSPEALGGSTRLDPADGFHD